MQGPRRHAEDVVLLPVEAPAVDDGVPAALGRGVDHGPGVPVRAGVLAGAQHLHLHADGRHHRAAGRGVHEVHDHPVEGGAVGHPREVAERLLRARPRIVAQGRVGPVPAGVGRDHAARPVHRVRGVDRRGRGLPELRVDPVERAFQGVDERDVEPVLPHDRGVGFGADPVVVPGAGRGEEEVLRTDVEDLAVDHRVAALPFEHEAKRRERVLMGREGLAGQHYLEAREQPAAGRPLTLPVRVDQHDDPPRRVLRGHELRRLHDLGAEVVPGPLHGARGGGGMLGLERVEHGPQRPRLVPFELPVECAQPVVVADLRAPGHRIECRRFAGCGLRGHGLALRRSPRRPSVEPTIRPGASRPRRGPRFEAAAPAPHPAAFAPRSSGAGSRPVLVRQSKGGWRWR